MRRKNATTPSFPASPASPAGYLYNQLLNFRDGRRRYPMMTYMVEHLPDAYLQGNRRLFFAAAPQRRHRPRPARRAAAPWRAASSWCLQGDSVKKIPACISCHGQQLAGVAPAIPGLLGLPRDYINAQFGAWKNGVRRAHAPDCMALIAERLSDADVGAVSSLAGHAGGRRQCAPGGRH